MPQKRRIGPGVYAVGPLSQIAMNPDVVKSRRERGLPVPRQCPHNLPIGCCAICADERKQKERTMTLHELLDTGYRRRPPISPALQIDAALAEEYPCPKCGGTCKYEGWHNNGCYIALSVCRRCGHEEEI